MFTLKLYQNGQGMPGSRMVVMEVAGIWSDHCDGNVQYVQAFKKKVGVMDDDGPHDFYVGGTPTEEQTTKRLTLDGGGEVGFAIVMGCGGNYYGWGVLENAQGKTTEIFR